MDPQKLREERMKLWQENKDLMDSAGTEALTAEQEEQYDKRDAKIDSLQVEIERIDKIERQEIWGEQGQGRISDPNNLENAGNTEQEETPEQLHQRAFRSFLRDGERALNAVELRALQADNDAQAGYLIPDEKFVAQLIQKVDDAVAIRGLATIHALEYGQNLGVPTLDTDIEDATWTSEIGEADEDTALAFGKRSLSTKGLAKLIKVSQPLLRSSALNAEGIVLERLAYKFAVTEEKGFMTGTGAGQPLGVFTASEDGITTSQDVQTGNTTDSITFDGLIEAKYELKAAYWSAARWIFHRDAVKQIRKLKDGDGQYTWQASVVPGAPDSILGLPIIVSEFAPSTFSNDEYVGILGDFSKYWIAESLAMGVQRLVEKYALTNQVGFIGRMEIDGMPVLAEAFRRVQLAS